MSLTSLDRKLLARLQRIEVLTEEQVAELILRVEQEATPLASLLIADGLADDKTIARQVARLCGLEFIDLLKHPPREEVRHLLTPEQAWHFRAVPLAETDEFLVVGVDDASNLPLVEELRLATGRIVRTVLVTAQALQQTLEELYLLQPGGVPDNSSTADFGAELTAGPSTDTLTKDSLAAHPTCIIALPDLAEAEDEHAEANVMGARTDEYLQRIGTTPEDLILRSGVVRRVQLDSSEPEATAEPSLDQLLHDMIDTALMNRAEELEIAPQSARRSRTRIRKDGYWLDATPYPLRLHTPLLARLRLLAGVLPSQRLPLEVHLTFTGQRGRIPAVASFTSTLRGDRCLLRFPENVPLLQDPLRVLGFADEDARTVRARLGAEEGGLFLLTSHKARLTQQLYASLLFDRANEDLSVLSLDSVLERTIPNVHQITCADEAALVQGLEHAGREAPDLLGVQSIGSPAALRAVLTACQQGQSVLACQTLPRGASALQSLAAGGLDADLLGTVLIAHAHVTRLPRLCPNCREPIGRRPSPAPDWAHEIPEMAFHEALGCPACAGTGRRGINWVCEIWLPEPGATPPLRQIRRREEVLQRLVEYAEADVRDVR
ncbi:MAG: hypothetical protein KF858_08335 [Candidatus Sumerlaeia bacterium]|nr:hypothetical protein [Candidatus Sumerlaeia bacterium]